MWEDNLEPVPLLIPEKILTIATLKVKYHSNYLS